MLKKIFFVLILGLIFNIFLSPSPVLATPFTAPDSEGKYPFSFWLGSGSNASGGTAYDFGMTFKSSLPSPVGGDVIAEINVSSIDKVGFNFAYFGKNSNNYVRLFYNLVDESIKLGFGGVDTLEIGKLCYGLNGGVLYHDGFGAYLEYQIVYKFLPALACYGKLDCHTINGNGTGIIVVGLHITP